MLRKAIVWRKSLVQCPTVATGARATNNLILEARVVFWNPAKAWVVPSE